jgi:hypothetical protein
MSSNDTQVTFELPKGFVDESGQVHKVGVMRLANAADEIMPMNDPRVKLNPAYLSILILERVITKLGSLPKVTTKVIENLFTADMAYLQDLYQKINAIEQQEMDIICPKCGEKFRVPVPFFDQA